jgi:hypothetical protein
MSSESSFPLFSPVIGGNSDRDRLWLRTRSDCSLGKRSELSRVRPWRALCEPDTTGSTEADRTLGSLKLDVRFGALSSPLMLGTDTKTDVDIVLVQQTPVFGGTRSGRCTENSGKPLKWKKRRTNPQRKNGRPPQGKGSLQSAFWSVFRPCCQLSCEFTRVPVILERLK